MPRDLAANDMLVKIAVASFCHTDKMVAAGTMGAKVPVTGSHEGAGTVVAVGSAVTGFTVGDRVMCGLVYHPCRQCADCAGLDARTRAGTAADDGVQYCTRLGAYLGVTADGFFAEYACVDAATTAPLPAGVRFATAAPLACAGSTVWRGILAADVREGQWLGIVGSGGGLGHLGIQFAKALGLKVVGVDARDEGLELSRQTGADCVVDARGGPQAAADAVQRATGGAGAHATLNLSDAPTAVATACAATRMHGVVVQIALSDTVAIPYRELVFRDVRVQGSLICSPDQARHMVDVVAKHHIRVHTNVFHGLAEVQKVVDLATSGTMKGKAVVVVDPDQLRKEEEAVGE